jgi:hypothetical protein
MIATALNYGAFWSALSGALVFLLLDYNGDSLADPAKQRLGLHGRRYNLLVGYGEHLICISPFGVH